MKHTLHLLTLSLLLALTLATSCTSYRNVPLMQNSDSINVFPTAQLFDAKIMPKDILTITVSVPEDPEAARPFNLVTAASRDNALGYMTSQVQLQQYIVSNEGTINFPLLGEIHASGLTKNQLEDYIADHIAGTHLKTRPIIVVTMMNYKVAVLGEVAHAGVFTASNGKINLLEALAQAGDMTIYGRRDAVRIIREDANGTKTIGTVNLLDASVITSPYYQLQQNDVVLVTPNRTKSKNSGIGSETSLWFTSVSIVISMASLLYNILN